MIDTRKNKLENFLQKYRFSMVKKFIEGDVLDFGGNEGELQSFVSGKYTIVNYDRRKMFDNTYDTIVLLAVIEHIEVSDVYKIFNEFKSILRQNGKIFLTTPTFFCLPILEGLSRIGLLSRKNILEHKHYWSRKDIFDLAEQNELKVVKYRKFQFGLNQYAVIKHK